VRRIKHIFVSYSRDDKHWTYEFAKALREDLNYSVFIPDAQTPPAAAE